MIGIEPDPGFERLRGDHLSERAPAHLRERLLERLHAPQMRWCEARTNTQHGRVPWNAMSLRTVGVCFTALAMLAAVRLWSVSTIPIPQQKQPSKNSNGRGLI